MLAATLSILRFVHFQLPAIHFFSIQGFDGSLSPFGGSHFHKGKAPELTCFSIRDHSGGKDFPIGGEQVDQTFLCGPVVQIPYIQPSFHLKKNYTSTYLNLSNENRSIAL